jgi:hypothetical protein
VTAAILHDRDLLGQEWTREGVEQLRRGELIERCWVFWHVGRPAAASSAKSADKWPRNPTAIVRSVDGSNRLPVAYGSASSSIPVCPVLALWRVWRPTTRQPARSSRAVSSPGP